jgi:hypothetical protein
VNSSSQESDADDSPKKRKSVDQSPPIRSPPVEISPEKPVHFSEKPESTPTPAEKTSQVKSSSEPSKEPVSQESKKSAVEEVKEPVSEEVKEPTPEKGKKPVIEKTIKPVEKVQDQKPDGDKNEREPVESKSEGAVEETMGRSRRRLSRLDSGSKRFVS